MTSVKRIDNLDILRNRWSTSTTECSACRSFSVPAEEDGRIDDSRRAFREFADVVNAKFHRAAGNGRLETTAAEIS